MHPWLAFALRWSGRALIVLGPLIVVAALFFPAGVQWLNPVLCPDGLELSNERDPGGFATADSRLELVCTSPTFSESAGPRVLLTGAGSVACGLALLYLSERAGRARYRAPTVERMH